jgi:hypothetical protein
LTGRQDEGIIVGNRTNQEEVCATVDLWIEWVIASMILIFLIADFFRNPLKDIEPRHQAVQTSCPLLEHIPEGSECLDK